MTEPRRSRKPVFATAAVFALATGSIVTWEGTKLATYIDPVGIPTACMGETGPHVRLGQRFTAEQCQAFLDKRLVEFSYQLDQCITQPIAAHEAAAVLSWAYNVGPTAACKSTLVRMINAGRPASEWCAQLDRWVYARGIYFQGLANRRAHERAICEGRKP